MIARPPPSYEWALHPGIAYYGAHTMSTFPVRLHNNGGVTPPIDNMSDSQIAVSALVTTPLVCDHKVLRHRAAARHIFARSLSPPAAMPTPRIKAALKYLLENNNNYKAFHERQKSILGSGGVPRISSFDFFISMDTPAFSSRRIWQSLQKKPSLYTKTDKVKIDTPWISYTAMPFIGN